MRHFKKRCFHHYSIVTSRGLDVVTGANLQCQAVIYLFIFFNYLHTKGMTSRLVFEKLYTISMRPEQIYLLSSVALDQLE